MTGRLIFPTRSGEAQAVRDLFFADFNEISFFVEDAEFESLYFEILKKLFPKVRIDQIFPLGGKDAVIAHWRTQRGTRSNRRSVYILDKDFDDLLGRQVKASNLCYLRRYSIENYLLEEAALVEMVVETEPRKKRAELAKRLKLKEFIARSISDMTPMTRLFIYVQRHQLPLANTSGAIQAYCKPNDHSQIEAARAEGYRRKVLREAVTRGTAANEMSFNRAVAAELPKSSAPNNTCGKHLMFLVARHIQRVEDVHLPGHDSMCYRLAKNCEFRSLAFLRKQVKTHIGSPSLVRTTQ